MEDFTVRQIVRVIKPFRRRIRQVNRWAGRRIFRGTDKQPTPT
jgi:hypothetical protein